MAQFLAIFLISILVFSSEAIANPSLCKNVFQRQVTRTTVRTFEESETTSQFIRDNAPDFWRWSKTKARRYFDHLLNFQGLVVGDAHPGNFAYSPLRGRMRMFILDIEDSGHAPYIVDVAHHIMATNSVFKEGKEDLDRSTERQLEAYLTGLRGGRFERHERIESIFENTRQDYLDEMAEYVDDKTEGSRFVFEEGKLESLEDKITNRTQRTKVIEGIDQHIISNLPGAKVLDYAYRPRERGGSQDATRFWALVKYQGEKQIIEFKEIQNPAVEQFGPQLPAIERHNLVMETFWGSNDRFYQVIDFNGKPFTVRPKKIELFKVPYKQRDKDERKFLRHLAAYEAYLIGKYHGQQMRNRRYANAIEQRFEELVERVNQMSDDYVERLEDRVQALQE